MMFTICLNCKEVYFYDSVFVLGILQQTKCKCGHLIGEGYKQ